MRAALKADKANVQVCRLPYIIETGAASAFRTRIGENEGPGLYQG